MTKLHPTMEELDLRTVIDQLQKIRNKGETMAGQYNWNTGSDKHFFNSMTVSSILPFVVLIQKELLFATHVTQIMRKGESKK